MDFNSPEIYGINEKQVSRTVFFQIEDERIAYDRQKIVALSAAFNAMLNGDFTESLQENIDISKNGISPSGMRAIRDFSETRSLNEICPDLLLELLTFSNKFCCERLKDACDRKLSSFVTSREEAVDLMEYPIV
ncbi:hypothetical protein IFM89_034836 [Coptis chinensis]|uniref:BTB domain-containing protein n=1 Tax=Coptis chinensis TaxID=261450 RepID=A0A835HDG4_9MAGN|nr:hypothetical protein IFM89_034836 [Coptis chinensis]